MGERRESRRTDRDSTRFRVLAGRLPARVCDVGNRQEREAEEGTREDGDVARERAKATQQIYA